MQEINVHSISLGCPKNRVDTECLVGALSPRVHLVSSPEEARLVLINTCGFIQPAVEESIRTILEMADAVARLDPKPLLAVTGCLVSRYGADLAADLPEVDLWLSTREMAAWPGRIAAALGEPGESFAPGRILSTPPGYAYLKVAEGCGHKCSFCSIPDIRGPLASRPLDELEAEARDVVTHGVKELVLVAQDTTGYGLDLGMRHGLMRLLDRLLPIDGLKWLRLLYLYPAGLTDEFLGYLKEAGPPFVPYFDIPLQHAHPDILRAMGRPFAADPRLVLDRVRAYFPDAPVRTSLITGFPGERPHHHKALLAFVEEARFHHLGVFPYCPEEGTPAGALKGQVGGDVKRRRREELMELQAEISREIMAGYVGTEQDILVDAPHPEWPGLYTGRAAFQAPEADGVTYISGETVAPGRMVKADIVESKVYDLVGLEL